MKKGRCSVLSNRRTRIFIETETGPGEGFSVERDVSDFTDVSFLTALSEAADMFLKYMDSEIHQEDQHTESVCSADSVYTYLAPQYLNNYVKVYE